MIQVQEFACLIFISLGYIQGVQLLDRMVILCLAVWGLARLFFTVIEPFYVPTGSVRGFQLLCIVVTNTVLFLKKINIIAIFMGIKWYLTVVLFWHSLMMLSIFSCACWSFVLVYRLWRNDYSSSLHIFKLACLPFGVVFLYILDSRPISDIWFANIFSRSVGCLFVFSIMPFDA